MCQMTLDFDAAKTEATALPIITGTTATEIVEIDLHEFDVVVINTSAGKDSMTALRQVVLMAERQGYDKSRLVCVHADLGECEWDGVQDLAARQAAHYGLEFHYEKQRNKAGQNQSILDKVLERRMWPDSQNRWCTSDFKRGPCERRLTSLDRQVKRETGKKAGRRILNVMGLRAEESPKRAKLNPIEVNKRSSNKSREVINYYPIHKWSTQQVWQDIHASGVEYHPAYDLGMPRLSCVFCVLAGDDALMLAGQHNPELLQRYVDVEREVGHTFKNGSSIESIQRRLQAGERVDAVKQWEG